MPYKVHLATGQVVAELPDYPPPLAPGYCSDDQRRDASWLGGDYDGFGYFDGDVVGANFDPRFYMAGPASYSFDAGAGRVTKTVNPVPRAIEVVRQELRGVVKTRRDIRVAAGYPYGGSFVQLDGESRGNLASARTMAKDGLWPAPPVGGWRLADNSWAPLTAEQIIALAEAASLYFTSLFAVQAALEQDIADAPDVETLQLVDIDGAWPAPAP